MLRRIASLAALWLAACGAALGAAPPADSVVIVVDFGDQFLVTTSGDRDCGRSAANYERIRFDPSTLNAAAAAAAEDYFLGHGIQARLAPAGMHRNGDPLPKASVARLQQEHPGAALLHLHVGAFTNPRWLPRGDAWQPEWITGGCQMHGPGLIRTRAGQASVLMARVSYYPPGQRRPAVREFNGWGPQPMPDVPAVTLSAPVADQDVRDVVSHLTGRAPADVSHLLNMYFEFLATRR